MIEGVIAIICLFAFVFTGDIEILKISGIFAIASYVGLIWEEIRGKNDE